ncbi:hypothetical protein HPB48_018136 [Haemaphysalis longicornis]|uniref:ZP domain-containing protein n=1 Tax=Haemaphysalis longicornis TaxID=44386 RepID=A0A9J6FU94_HAELO|nr:hypothetical protein HPB48_018136 [Haemaphysalis longicornis]
MHFKQVINSTIGLGPLKKTDQAKALSVIFVKDSHYRSHFTSILGRSVVTEAKEQDYGCENKALLYVVPKTACNRSNLTVCNRRPQPSFIHRVQSSVDFLPPADRSAGHAGGHGYGGGLGGAPGAGGGVGGGGIGGYAPPPPPSYGGHIGGGGGGGGGGPGGYHHGWHGIHATHRGYPSPGVAGGGGYDAPSYPHGRWPPTSYHPLPGRGSSIGAPSGGYGASSGGYGSGVYPTGSYGGYGSGSWSTGGGGYAGSSIGGGYSGSSYGSSYGVGAYGTAHGGGASGTVGVVPPLHGGAGTFPVHPPPPPPPHSHPPLPPVGGARRSTPSTTVRASATAGTGGEVQVLVGRVPARRLRDEAEELLRSEGVSQTCTPDGMEFSLRTVDGFYGRIYTALCILTLSQYGDVMTNIVVVQFNDYVQTSRDKKYNLTCYFSGPGEAVVTSQLSRYKDGWIEHLPAQNILTSNVQLRILYRGTPTTTIAVGDLLTFRLEARGKYQFDFYSDIFATNVIAKDPYSGRQVHLIDSRGCPVDLYVFPELHKAPDGALEAEFYAFKIPDSNLLVFQATVRTCRGPCEPVICSDRGRPGTFPSWGRRRKRAVPPQTGAGPPAVALPIMKVNSTKSAPASAPEAAGNQLPKPAKNATKSNSSDEEAEEVHELLHVYLSRADIPHDGPSALYKKPTVCVAQSGYYALVAMLALLICALVGIAMGAMFYVRRVKLQVKDVQAGMTSPSPCSMYVSQFQAAPPVSKFEDPSEPIYTDPSLFERSRSLRSLTVSHVGKLKGDFD